MPRDVTPALKGWMRGETMQMAICVKVTTQAPWNRVLGFTTWDSDLTVDGVTYEHGNAILGSAASSSAGSGVDNMEVTGLLVSVSITDADIYAGVYDKARLQMFVVNPADLTMLGMVVINGVLGDFKTSDGTFVVELRSLTQLMSQQVGDSVVPTCQVARFMDSRCKFAGTTDMSGNPVSSTGTVTSVDDDLNIHMSGIVLTGGYYSYGTMKFTTGQNANIEREVKVHGNGGSIVTANSASSPASPGSVPFNSNTSSGWVTSCGTNFSIPIPQGVWTNAWLSLVEVWSLVSQAQQGTTGLYVQLPVGDQYLVANEGWSGEYQHNLQLGQATLTAINTAAGSPGNSINGCLQFHNDVGQHLHDISVTALILTLEGTPATTSDLLQIGLPFPYPVAPGDHAVVTAGCDRLVTTCNNKWNNVVNFRGFPYLPGTDLILKSGHS